MTFEWLKELWFYKELFYFMTLREVKLRYRQTLLGVLWAVIQPFATMVVFAVIFGNVLKVPINGIPYPVFYYSALLPWIYFSTTLGHAGNSLIGNANLLNKVYFPRVILPASSALVGLVDLASGTLVLLGIMAYYRLWPTWEFLLWPLLVIPLIFLAFGLGMLLSALNVKYRDVKFVIPFLLQLWLFATPIIYPVAVLPQHFRSLMLLNPLSGIIEAFRHVCVPKQPIDLIALCVSYALVVLIVFLGMIYFMKTERYFSDVI